ncbi:MAG: hypothetical protein H0T83_06630 [Chthoniobacterales bacterium]|nr:hypothetical protein [Chthoniobacterales bacterium]
MSSRGRAWPGEKDAFEVPLLACKLALVYARTGEIDQAIQLIERFLTTPGAGITRRTCSQYRITLMDLRLRWEWDPLRSDPRFQAILASPEPKTIPSWPGSVIPDGPTSLGA